MIQINTLEGYENVKDYYYCDEAGEIWSKSKAKLTTMEQGRHHGYATVRLIDKNGARKYYLVHRIIATAFIPNPESKPTVNHKNHIRDDNRIENLEWFTDDEQYDDIWKEKKYTPVLLIDEQTEYSITFPSVAQCAKYLGIYASGVCYYIRTGGLYKGRYKLKEIKK